MEFAVERPAVPAVLDALAAAAGDGLVLWRGPDLGGRDIDLLVLRSIQASAARILLERGLRPYAGDAGHVVWRSENGAPPELDFLLAAHWPAAYPSLEGVLARAVPGPAGLRVGAPEDRVLIFVVDAVGGRPLGKLAPRIRRLLSEPGVLNRLADVAAAEGLEPLAALAADPEALLARARRGRLPYGGAVSLALRSRPARAALRGRLHARRRRRPKGWIVTLSGIDGSGKSTAARTAMEAAQAAGMPTTVAWSRFGTERAILDAFAGPVKRALRRSGNVARPTAADGPAVGEVPDVREATRRGPLSWLWIVFVAGVNARSLRRVASPARQGTSVVCDRWLVDSLVDLRLRYGRHRLAEGLLKWLVPAADLSMFLDAGWEIAARRKPGDQYEKVLAEAARLYAELAPRHGLSRIDSTAPLERVAAAVARNVSELMTAAAPPVTRWHAA
jgi:thymidylate kinase